jgi:LPS-assembly protein
VTSIAALTAAALLAGLSASPLGSMPGASGDVTWRAGQVTWHGETGRYELSGGAVVQRGGVVLRAREATIDPATGEVWARGDVLLLDATRVLSADTLHAVLDGPFEASDVLAYLKEKPLDPPKIASAAEARRGRNRLTFRADRAVGDEERLRLTGLRLTPCDCGEGRAPSWEVRARRAEVEGDRVALHWPVLVVRPTGGPEDGGRHTLGYEDGVLDRPIPILTAPWMSLPLTDRQSGLLFPELGREGVGGFHLGLPVFVTLGRSADLTATPEYFFGPKTPNAAGGAVKGPGAKLELRWAPAERAFGEVLFHVVDDLDRERLPFGRRGGGGLRLSIQGAHAQDLGPATRLRIHADLSQDPFMFRDFPAAGLPRDAYYSRTDALVSRRTDAWVVEGGAAYYEQLEPEQKLRTGLSGWFDAGAPKLQRWPWAAATFLPRRVAGFQLQGRLGLGRWAPLAGDRGELLQTDPATNPWGSDPARPREGVAVSDPGTAQAVVRSIPRDAATRADGRLQLSAPMLLGDWLSLEPYVRGAANGYAFETGRAPAATAWGAGGAAASVELSRRYGKLEHRIVPRLDLLAGTSTWRRSPGDPFPAYDLWDRIESARTTPVAGVADPLPVAQKLSAAPDGSYTQLRASLENRLEGGPAGRLALEIGQDADVRRGKLAETFASLSASRGPWSADASARFLAFGSRPRLTAGWRRSWLDEFTGLHAAAAYRVPRGDNVRVALDATGAGAVGAQGAGVDALFDLRSTGAAPDAYYSARAHLVLTTSAALDYDVRVTARTVPVIGCGAGNTKQNVDAFRVTEQQAALVWDSPCHCFTARVNVGDNICGDLTYGVSVDLSRIFQGAAPKPAK